MQYCDTLYDPDFISNPRELSTGFKLLTDDALILTQGRMKNEYSVW